VERSVAADRKAATVGYSILAQSNGAREIRIDRFDCIDHDGRMRNVDRARIDVNAKRWVTHCWMGGRIRRSAGALTGEGNDFM
jgi:hypothetical protein